MERKSRQNMQKLYLMLTILFGAYNMSSCYNDCSEGTKKDILQLGSTEQDLSKAEQKDKTKQAEKSQKDKDQNQTDDLFDDEDIFDDEDAFDFSDLDNITTEEESKKTKEDDNMNETFEEQMSQFYDSLTDEEKESYDKEIAEAKEEQEKFEAMTPEEQKEYIKNKYADWDEMDDDFDDINEMDTNK